MKGVFLKESAQKLVTKGLYARVPLISSDCEDEGTLFALMTPNMTTGAVFSFIFRCSTDASSADQDFTSYIKSNYLPNATDDEIAQVALHYPQDPSAGSPYGS